MTTIVQQPVDLLPSQFQQQIVLSVVQNSSTPPSSNGGGGVFDMWSDVDCWFHIGVANPSVTSDKGYLIKGGFPPICVKVKNLETIWAIAAGAGTLRYIRSGHLA